MLFDFRCDNDHTHEAWVDSDVRTDKCPQCELTASRIISGTSFSLEGVTGDFPGAKIKWDNRHITGGKL
jgi:Zn finger protein HypA/HybF involved in hydrogenase expression